MTIFAVIYLAALLLSTLSDLLVTAQEDKVSYAILEDVVNGDAAHRENITAYEEHFRNRRSLSIWEPSRDILQVLGENLCKYASSFNEQTLSEVPYHWRVSLEELLRIERNPSNCSTFHEYHQRGWNPHLFRWSTLLHGEFIQQRFRTLKTDPDYFTTWSSAIVAGISYARDMVQNVHLGRHFLRLERVEHAIHLYSLFKCTGLLPKNFQQIIEYGAGTGDNAAYLREMQFQGVHFIVDIPPMLYFQNFFQKYSGWPSYFGENLTSLNGRKLILESSLSSSKLNSHLNAKHSRNTLFLATFTAANIPDLNIFSKYGTLLIAFTNTTTASQQLTNLSFLGAPMVDNLQTVEEWVSILASMYSICVWGVAVDDQIHHYYFMARLKTMGNTKCDSTVGCTEKTKLWGNC